MNALLRFLEFLRDFSVSDDIWLEPDRDARECGDAEVIYLADRRRELRSDAPAA